MRTLLLLSMTALSLVALDIDVDQGWGFRTSSHHLHFAGGAAMGAVGYTGLRLVGLQEEQAFWGSAIGGSLVAVAYEVKNDRQGQDSFADPADALWTVGGVFLGDGLAYLTEEAVEIALTPKSAALSWSKKF